MTSNTEYCQKMCFRVSNKNGWENSKYVNFFTDPPTVNFVGHVQL